MTFLRLLCTLPTPCLLGLRLRLGQRFMWCRFVLGRWLLSLSFLAGWVFGLFAGWQKFLKTRHFIHNKSGSPNDASIAARHKSPCHTLDPLHIEPSRGLSIDANAALGWGLSLGFQLWVLSFGQRLCWAITAAFVGLCWLINCSLSLGRGLGLDLDLESDIGCVLFTNECTNFGQSPAVRVTDSMTLGQAAQSHKKVEIQAANSYSYYSGESAANEPGKHPFFFVCLDGHTTIRPSNQARQTDTQNQFDFLT